MEFINPPKPWTEMSIEDLKTELKRTKQERADLHDKFVAVGMYRTVLSIHLTQAIFKE